MVEVSGGVQQHSHAEAAVPKILLSEHVHPDAVALLRQEPGYDVVEAKGDKEAFAAHLAQSDAIGVRIQKLDGDTLARALRLRLVAKHGVGYDNIDVEAATQKRIPVTNTREANAESVAEHDLGLMFAISRNICSSDRALRQGKVKRREAFMGVELEGKTLGVIGLGRTGSGLAYKCNMALSMPVICYDPYVPGSIVSTAAGAVLAVAIAAITASHVIAFIGGFLSFGSHR